jgi:putative DNA-invertase from lambdoid prophage Rac
MRAALYGRVSTADQHPENQLAELRQYAAARGWTVTREYVDEGISGAKDRRPALDELLRDARRRKFDVIAVARLDRLGRSLKHLVVLLDELAALGVAFVSINEAIDATTPGGKLQMHLLAAMAEYERELIRERVRSGLARVRAQGKRLGRPRIHPRAPGCKVTVRQAAALWGVAPSTAAMRLARGEVPEQTSSEPAALSPRKTGTRSTPQ